MRQLAAAIVVTTVFATSPAAAQDAPERDDTEASGAAEDTTDGESSTPSTTEVDAAWRAFHDAFVKLARGEPAASARQLLQLRRDFPDHPSALFARPVLSVYRGRVQLADTTIPPDSEWPPTSEHPAVRDESSPVYDPAWARYREAFVALAEDNTTDAKLKLEKLRRQTPEHPSASLARDALSALGERDEMLVQSADDMDSGDVASETTDTDSSAAQPPPPEVFETRTPLGWRILAEVGGGLLGGMAGGITGGVLGFSLGLAANDWDTRVASVYGSVGITAGVLGAIPAGVYIAGDLSGADGHLLWTYLGGLAGMGVGGLAGMAAPRASGVVVPILLFTGPIVGYEISHSARSSAPRGSDRVRLRPFATPHRQTDTGLFGLQLTF